MGVSRLSAPQAWIKDWTPGANLSNLFALYPSLGSAYYGSNYNIPTEIDGPIKVLRYDSLSIGTNTTVSVTNRCRGLVILYDSLYMTSSSVITMAGRGAAGSPKWANQDILIPNTLRLQGRSTSYRDFAAWVAANGYAIFDPTLFACPLPGMGDVQADYASWPARGATIISAAGCGVASVDVANGTPGHAGSNGGCGGGGQGGTGYGSSRGAPGRVWGGGPGGGGSASASGLNAADSYGGPGGAGGPAASNNGGGAGNPGGAASGTGVAGAAGTGGVLILIGRGNATLNYGHALSSNGMPGGDSGASGGGGAGSGAGSVSFFYGGTLTGSPNLVATGGPAGAGGLAGSAGGVGGTRVATLTQMGWG